MKIFFYFLIISITFIWLTNNAFATESEYKILINEVMPNPIGDDTKLEWIELKNISTEHVNLKNWKLNGLALPDFDINSGEIILLTRDINSISSTNQKIDFTFNLVNSGATLTLLETETSVEQVFNYVQSIEGRSFELLSGDCSNIEMHSSSHTMGLENTSCEAFTVPTNTPSPTIIYYTTHNYQDLIISAVSPFPSEGNEWVEIVNNSKAEINLTGWIIKDESNKSYKLTEYILNSGEKTKIFPTTISLNNDGDIISLYDPQNKLIDSFKYEKVTKDQVVTPSDDMYTEENPEIAEEREENLLDQPQVKSINTFSNEKSIYEILKKPIYYQVEDYVELSD
jgi:hypothetical protein